MEQHLQFKIGSTFSGEGFTKLKTSVAEANNTVKTATGAASKAATALGQLDTSGSKAAGAVTGLVGALMTGGVQGLVFAGAMMAINGYLSRMKEELAECQKRAESLKASAKESFADVTSEIKNGIAKEISDLTSKFDTITKSATAFTNAMNGLSSSQSAGNIINLEIEKFNAMIEENTDAGKKNIEAIYAIKEAEEKAAASETELRNKRELATTARVAAEEKAAAMHDEERKVAEEVKSAEAALKEAVENQADNRKELSKFLKDLQAKEEEVHKKAQQATEDASVATIAERTAIQNYTNGVKSGMLAVDKAKKAHDDLVNSLEREERAAEERADDALEEQELAMEAARSEADAAKELADAKKECADMTEEAAQATADVAKAESKLKAAVDAYNGNITQNLVNETIQGSVRTNGTMNTWGNLIANRGTIAAESAEVAVAELLQNGSILTTDQLRQARNQAKREANETINSKEVNQQIKDEERAARLAQRSEKALSKADKEWLEDYNKVKEAKDAQKNAVQAAKDEQIFAQMRQQRAFDNIAAIKKKMDDLGLK